jgi:hypothetical protein
VTHPTLLHGASPKSMAEAAKNFEKAQEEC